MSKFKNFAPPREARITFRLAIRRGSQWFVVGRKNVVIEQQTYVCCFEIEPKDLSNIEIFSFREVASRKEFLGETLDSYKKYEYFNSRKGEIEAFDFEGDSTLCML